MQFQDDVIDEVIQRTDIVELIGKDVRLRRVGSSYQGLCPFHSEKTPSFHVTPSKQLYYCFGCHAGGNAITYMMEYHNYTFVEAIKILAENAGIRLPKESLTPGQREASEKKASLLELYKTAAAFYYYQLKSPKGERGLNYLKERGLTQDTIRSFGLGFAEQTGSSLYRYLKSKEYSDELLHESGLFYFDEKKGASDRFWNRVMFPIQDVRGRVIGFGGRVMGEGKPKYLNSPETFLFNKRKQLYALNYAKTSRRGYLILCEGYMDVITMHQAGFTNACASLGTALTQEHCTIIRRYAGEVLLLYDSDSAGINAALRAIPLLKEAGITPRVVNLSPCKDPDEFIRKEGTQAMETRLREAENAFLFELRQLEGSYRRSDPAEWTAFQREAARKLVGIPDEMERENYLEAVCGRYGFDRAAMGRLVSRTAAEGTPAASYRPPKTGTAKPVKPDGYVTAQRLMLTYLANEPEAYAQTKSLITADDFTDPLCAKVAKALYRQMERGHVSEAELIAAFPDSEEQREAVEMFHTSIPVNSQAELDRAFTDTVMRLLSLGNDARLLESDLSDMSVLDRYIETKQELEQFENGKMLHIPWREGDG